MIITTTKGTKLTHKAGILEEVSEKGFLIKGEEGEEYITLDLIKEYFLGRKVKITIEEVNKEIMEV